MSTSTPTIAQLAGTIISQLEATFSQTIPLLPKGFTRVLGAVIAGGQVLTYKRADWGILQVFVQSASFEEVTILGKTFRPLVWWGELLGAGQPFAAVDAEIVCSVDVVTVDSSKSVKQGQKLTYSPNGVAYEVAFEVPLSTSTVQVTIRPVSGPNGTDGSGTVGNVPPGAKIQFASPPGWFAREATVVYQTVTGADAETGDKYRARVMKRAQAKPQGGALADYRAWGESVPGIANVYPYRGQPGEIDVYIEATVDSFGNADGIPTSDQIDQVYNAILYENSQDALNVLATRSPANDKINPKPIVRNGLSVRVFGALSTSYRAELEAGLDEYFRDLEPFIVGLSSLPKRNTATPAGAAAIVEGIASLHGETASSVTLYTNGGVVQSRPLNMGEKAKLVTLYLPLDSFP